MNPLANIYALDLRGVQCAMNWHKAYRHQASRARVDANGLRIEMRMSFEEWLAVWQASGKLHLRGNRRGGFVMARRNDLGHYEVGNVDIIPHEENVAAARRGKPLTKQHRAKVSAARAGKPCPSVTRSASCRQSAQQRPRLSCLHCRRTFTSASHALHLKSLKQERW